MQYFTEHIIKKKHFQMCSIVRHVSHHIRMLNTIFSEKQKKTFNPLTVESQNYKYQECYPQS